MVFAAGGSAQGGAGSGSANYGPRTTGPNYWLVKYAQPVTLHAVNADEANVNYGPGEDITNNGWTKGMKEYLNVNVVTDWVSASSEYDTKMNLSIASRQLPDVFRVNAVQFKQLLEAGMLADLTDYVENNVSDTIKAIMAYVPEVTATAFQNGRQYAFPVYGYGPIPMPKLLWIRHDWMEASGAKAPVTIAEMENLMKTFQTAHPGAYGMGLNKDLDEMYWLAAAFKAYPGYWITGSNGTIVNGGVQPEMRDVLRTFADWYQKGYLRKDFMALDMAAVGQDTMSGKQGINIFWQWWYTYAADTVKNGGNDAYFEAYEMPSASGSPVVHPRDFDNGNYIVINKNCKNIDAAIKCISFIQYIVRGGLIIFAVLLSTLKNKKVTK
jgi:putative aldouronate transport system substrate-binding protein